MGQFMKHNTYHNAIITKFRPTMARMTGANTSPILVDQILINLRELLHPMHRIV